VDEEYISGTAGLTMVPNVPWHRAPRRKGAPVPRRKSNGLLLPSYEYTVIHVI